MRTDEELVAAALEGSASAFAPIVERYQERLLRFLIARCATRADAEDVLQDTFLNAWRYLPTYRPRWRFSTWLYRIAIRNASKRRDVAPIPYDGHAEGGDDPLAACILDSDRANIWYTARRILKPEACAALWLRYVEDLPVRDVARALGRSEPWTKVTLMRARRRLEAELGDGAAAANESNAYG